VTKQAGSRPPPATVDSAAARRASLRVISPASAHPSPSCYNCPSLAPRAVIHKRYAVPLANLQASPEPQAASFLTVRASHVVRGVPGVPLGHPALDAGLLDQS